jgi:biopolymer transport protein ExbB
MNPQPYKTVTQLLQLIRPILIALALFGVAMTVSSRTASAQSADPPAAKVESQSLLDIYVKGGWVMHAIAASSFAVIAVIGYCVTRIRKKTMIPSGLQASLAAALANQDVTGAMKLCDADPSSLSHVIKETLTKAGAGVEFYSKADLEAAAAETIFHEETRFMLWVNMLNGLAAVAPMMGLLGTVSGMIGSFEQLAAGAAKPSDFAGGIGEAMITTAAALIVAIPAMMAYFVFKNMLQALVSELAHSTSTLINRFVSGHVSAMEPAIEA